MGQTWFPSIWLTGFIVICIFITTQSLLYNERPGCYTLPDLSDNVIVDGIFTCFSYCQTAIIGIFDVSCFCTPTTVILIPCSTAVQCKDGDSSPCGFDACFVFKLKSIPYSIISDSKAVEVGQSVTITCVDGRYPNANTEWWIKKTVQCIGPLTWEIIVDILQCSAACDVPLLTNGEVFTDSINMIGKVKAGTIVKANCNHGYKLSTLSLSQKLTCQEVDSQWLPQTTCKPVCYLKTLNSIAHTKFFYDTAGHMLTADVGETQHFACNRGWYPIVGTEWRLNSMRINCILANTWENVMCMAACEKPKLENGQFESHPAVNSLNKVNANATVMAFCDYGFVLSSGSDKEKLTCSDILSQWRPSITCQPRCRLLCVNNGKCTEDPLDKSQRCICQLGFTGTLCEIAIEKGKQVDELLKIRDQTALFTTVADMAVYVMSQISVKQRIDLEVPSNQLISECSLAGKPCAPYRQNAFVHVGSCYTINHDPTNLTIMKQAGVAHGMHLVMFNNETEFLPHSLVKGVKLIIHDQDESVFPENQGRFLSPGFHILIAIKLEQINKFYKKCASEGVLKSLNNFYNDTYTVEGCLKSCHQKKVIETCGCGDPNVVLDPKNTHLKYCSLKKRECVNSVKSITSDECRCPEACRTSIYEATYSFAKWPTEKYNAPRCKLLSKEEKNWSGKWLKECNGAYRASHVKVDIYYKDLEYFVYTERPVYSFWNLWSSIGSVLAIYFGFSYMFFFEVLQFIYELCIAAAKKAIRAWRRMISVGPEQPNVQG